MRTIVAVIVISILIGVGIFYFSKGGNSSALSKTTASFNQETSSNKESTSENPTSTWYPSSTPRPTHPPLDKSSDLEAEAEKLDPQDYSKDFEDLRDQI